MTAQLIRFEHYRRPENDPTDAFERVFSAMSQYRSAELLELLYVGQEPGFFDLVRGLYALPEADRLALQKFLCAEAPPTRALVDQRGRLVLHHSACE